jgi:hypothetical protein
VFGFFKKKEDKPAASVPAPLRIAAGDGPLLEAAIARLRSGNRNAYPAFLKALLQRSVTVLLQEPGQLQTCLVLNVDNKPFIAVFTKPQFSEKFCDQGHSHLMVISMPHLCAMISDDVGLAINPDHPLLGFRLPAGVFMHLRETLAKSRPPLHEGGIYSVRNEDGTYSVFKILKLDEGGVHIRQYSNFWPAPPTSVDESTFFICGREREREEKLGMYHLPISKKSFAGWDATFVQQSTVSEEELEGYKLWIEHKGGYF